MENHKDKITDAIWFQSLREPYHFAIVEVEVFGGKKKYYLGFSIDAEDPVKDIESISKWGAPVDPEALIEFFKLPDKDKD